MGLPLRSVSLLFLLPLVAVGLSPGPARAAAQCSVSPTVPRDIGPGALGSSISEPVNVNGTLFFVADDGVSGKELWKSDGTPAGTVLVKDIRAGASADPRLLTAVGATLFFVVPGVTQGMELWKSDGSPGGTVLLKAFSAGAASGAQLTAVDSTLYFVAEQVNGDNELWKSDGTPTGTVPAADIFPGQVGSYPSELTAVDKKLFFWATEPSGGSELWKSDTAGTARVTDLVPGAPGSFPSGLTAVGQLLFFSALNEMGNTTLWRTDGTPAGTVLIRDFGDAAGATLQFPTAAGNTLFFQLNAPASGAELWKSDGTLAGTVLVKDIQPGPGSSSPEKLTAVGSTLFFVANDSVHGKELWKSDGSAGGTRLVRDIVPGSGNPDFGQLAAGPGVLLMNIDEPQSGGEPWRSDGTLEGTYRMADLRSGANASAPREFRFSNTKLFFVATEATQGEELFTVSLQQVDCTPPVFNCPARVDIEALSSRGVWVDSPPLGAVDDAVFGLGVFFKPASSMLLPLGTTRVTAFARDLVGNESQCTFDIAVVDRTSPLVLCPERVEQEATGPDGVKATFFVVANDAVTDASQLSVAYQPALGSTFPVGTSNVTATVTDAALNSAMCTFPLTVRDTTPPQLTCPAEVFQVATREEELSVSYTVLADDTVTPDAELTVNIAPAPGSRLPLGETVVRASAADKASNVSECSFKVRVVDPQGPSILCPETQYANVSGDEGAEVDFAEATATDNLGEVTIRYSHAPGSTFPEGETEVTATATDLGGQTASCTFKVVVERGGGGGAGGGTSCQAGPWSGGLGWLLLVLIPAWARRRAGRQGL